MMINNLEELKEIKGEDEENINKILHQFLSVIEVPLGDFIVEMKFQKQGEEYLQSKN